MDYSVRPFLKHLDRNNSDLLSFGPATDVRRKRKISPPKKQSNFNSMMCSYFGLRRLFKFNTFIKMEVSPTYISLPASKQRLYDYNHQAMDWPYQFVTPSEAEKHKRRILNDQYSLYAHLSVLLPLAGLLLIRVVRWMLKKATDKGATYDTKATSFAAAYYETIIADSPSAKWRQFVWWLNDNVGLAGRTLGRRDQLIFGGIWMVWLLFLCINDTGNGTYS